MALKVLLAHTTLLDRVLLVLLTAGAISGCLAAASAERGEQVVVEQGGRTLFVAPLGQERTVSFPGPLGETVLAVREGGARILSSPCPHQTCMGMGEVNRRGDLLACVPNNLLVRITGGKKEEAPYDLLSR